MPPVYSPLPTVDPTGPQVTDKQLDLEAALRHKRKTTVKRIAFHVLAVLAIMYALVLAVKEFPAACRMVRSKGMHMKNGTYVYMGHNMTGCHGANRTMSTASGLPGFYTLPSGDKIPSVALGESCTNPLCSWIITTRVGVWRADPGHVGEAVKVCLLPDKRENMFS